MAPVFLVLPAGRAAGCGRILLSLLCVHDGRTSPDTECRPTAALSGEAPCSIQGRRCESVINGTHIARDGDREDESWTEIRRRLGGSRRSVRERLPLVEPLCNVCSNGRRCGWVAAVVFSFCPKVRFCQHDVDWKCVNMCTDHL